VKIKIVWPLCLTIQVLNKEEMFSPVLQLLQKLELAQQKAAPRPILNSETKERS
jgi:hypothetical protein